MQLPSGRIRCRQPCFGPDSTQPAHDVSTRPGRHADHCHAASSSPSRSIRDRRRTLSRPFPSRKLGIRPTHRHQTGIPTPVVPFLDLHAEGIEGDAVRRSTANRGATAGRRTDQRHPLPTMVSVSSPAAHPSQPLLLHLLRTSRSTSACAPAANSGSAFFSSRKNHLRLRTSRSSFPTLAHQPQLLLRARSHGLRLAATASVCASAAAPQPAPPKPCISHSPATCAPAAAPSPANPPQHST